jgi:hypothetical protein
LVLTGLALEERLLVPVTFFLLRGLWGEDMFAANRTFQIVTQII